ncbi:hypothetical protein [Helicobacter sp. 11S02596-1]|uniref:hypothetical protein n=1 Tax=Helicobacter sp. 11S02596-1 TaxID=1476194 RepID=UPI000BA5B1F6|nr:hypothetical protein [Helicobacter sp. 11S02596-1]PAF41383.1 hypothetical protein BJI48_08815 [Helicobacter sp. 11S02596-1]
MQTIREFLENFTRECKKSNLENLYTIGNLEIRARVLLDKLVFKYGERVVYMERDQRPNKEETEEELIRLIEHHTKELSDDFDYGVCYLYDYIEALRAIFEKRLQDGENQKNKEAEKIVEDMFHRVYEIIGSKKTAKKIIIEKIKQLV